MSASRTFWERPRPQMFTFHDWPIAADDQAEARHVGEFLDNLNRYVERFWFALALVAWSEKVARDTAAPTDPFFMRNQEAQRQFQAMAFRDAAMTLFHFGRTMPPLKRSLAKCRSLSALLDHAPLRAAASAFRAAFPEIELVRHAVAHNAEVRENDAKRKEHSVSGKHSVPGITVDMGAGGFVSEFRAGPTFSTTFQGRLVKYDLSLESWQALDRIADMILSEFERAADAARH